MTYSEIKRVLKTIAVRLNTKWIAMEGSSDCVRSYAYAHKTPKGEKYMHKSVPICVLICTHFFSYQHFFRFAHAVVEHSDWSHTCQRQKKPHPEIDRKFKRDVPPYEYISQKRML